MQILGVPHVAMDFLVSNAQHAALKVYTQPQEPVRVLPPQQPTRQLQLLVVAH
jgi:hypothetical protein